MGGADPDKPPGPQPRERRQHPRTKVELEAELYSEGKAAPLRVKTADLSLGGCYIEMMFTLEVGTKLKIALWINDAKLNIEGMVATRDLQVGNGIKFANMAPEDRIKLQRFLASV